MRRENIKRLFKQRSSLPIANDGSTLPLQLEDSNNGFTPKQGEDLTPSELSRGPDFSPVLARSSSSGLHLPGTKRTRQAAGKAGRAVASGATKVATAFKRRLKRNAGSAEETEALADIIGAVEDAFVTSSDESEDGEVVSDTSEAEHGENELGTASSEKPSRSSPPSEGSRESDPKADRKSHAKQVKELMAASANKSESGWDSSKFRNVRALQLGSIWDIPTSREPNPEPRKSHEDVTSLPKAKSGANGASGMHAHKASGQPQLVSFGGGAAARPRLASCKWLRRLMKCFFTRT
mmetsp:Transcript_41829/g.94090  ORF Transcript_41829/g.94090 Transcript_41829/m.94090 type:complete len:294 (-) Transcript_41829:38-919(-)